MLIIKLFDKSKMLLLLFIMIICNSYAPSQNQKEPIHVIYGLQIIKFIKPKFGSSYIIGLKKISKKLVFVKSFHMKCTPYKMMAFCEEELLKFSNMNIISKNQILRYIIYDNTYDIVTTDREWNAGLINDKIYLNESLIYSGFHRQLIISDHIYGLYFFANHHVDLFSGTLLDEAFIYIVNFTFIIGFKTIHPNLYDPIFVSNVKIRDKKYTIFANNFRCSGPVMLFQLVLGELYSKNIKYSKITKSILNPCIPSDLTIKVFNQKKEMLCFANRIQPLNVTFKGMFDLLKCSNILKKILYDKNLCGKFKGCNLYKMTKNIIISPEISKINIISGIHLEQSLSYKLFIRLVLDKVGDKCIYTSFNNQVYQNAYSMEMALYECLNVLVLYEILNDNILYDKRLYFEQIAEKKILKHPFYFFSDPRIGFLVESNTIPLKLIYLLKYEKKQFYIKLLFHRYFLTSTLSIAFVCAMNKILR